MEALMQVSAPFMSTRMIDGGTGPQAAGAAAAKEAGGFPAF
jgi:hypothetical protein